MSLPPPTVVYGSSPFLISLPHSGQHYPEDLQKASCLSPLVLRRSEDAFLDQLFAWAPARDISMIIAQTARAYVDVNRDPKERDPVLEGIPLRHRPTAGGDRLTAPADALRRQWAAPRPGCWAKGRRARWFADVGHPDSRSARPIAPWRTHAGRAEPVRLRLRAVFGRGRRRPGRSRSCPHPRGRGIRLSVPFHLLPRRGRRRIRPAACAPHPRDALLAFRSRLARPLYRLAPRA